MNPDCFAPDQPSPEAPPLTEETPPLPVIETLADYPSGVERRHCAPPKPLAASASTQTSRKKKQKLPHDWHAKRRMLFYCILLLIANICVGTYLYLTWGKRSKRTPGPAPIQIPEKPNRIVVPAPERPGDVG